MSRTQVRDLKENTLVMMQTFLLTELKILQTKNGKDYASFKIGDKSGTLQAVWWEYPLAPDGMKGLVMSGGLVDLGGEVTSYNGKLQFKVVGVAPPTTTDMIEFERRSKYDESEMWADFLDFADSFTTPIIRQLALRLVDKYAQQVIKKPAATGMHHAFKHGLLEHTLQMLETAEKLFELPFYAEVLNKDYCMFGVMFHDFMKIFEYGDGPDFKRSRLGLLVPHIPKMAAVIEAEAEKIGMGEEMMTYLQSIVLSHHRFMEWGSPVKPASPEALFVHYIDNLHGDVFGVIQKLEADAAGDDSIKYGFGDQAYTIMKKRFSEVIEGEAYDQAKDTSIVAGEEDSMGGF